MTQTCLLAIHKLELTIFLGWRDDEQERKQIVYLDLDIHFPTPPVACETDQLADSICYADLISQIRAHLGDKKFRLIECVAKEIYALVKPLIPAQTKLNLRLNKFPQIQGLVNGVSFTYGDK